jgi:hypothetical protein
LLVETSHYISTTERKRLAYIGSLDWVHLLRILQAGFFQESVMKTSSMFKTLGLCALVSLSLNAGLAQADNGSCILGSAATPQVAAPRMNNGDAGSTMMSQMEARMNQQLDRIEQGLRNGQLSPMQAGKMMREQWEAMQFQRGFLEGSKAGGRCAENSASGRDGGGDSCALMQGIDTRQIKQIAAKLAPVMGSLAAEGMQTATTVMRALGREVEKRTQDAPLDDRF